MKITFTGHVSPDSEEDSKSFPVTPVEVHEESDYVMYIISIPRYDYECGPNDTESIYSLKQWAGEDECESE